MPNTSYCPTAASGRAAWRQSPLLSTSTTSSSTRRSTRRSSSCASRPAPRPSTPWRSFAMSRFFLLLLLLFLPALDDVLREIDTKGRTVGDFQATFKQEKSVYLLDEPLRSEGTVLYKREPALL